MAKKLDGKIALVTGGTSGIGLATAKRFISEGAKVVITGRRAEVLQKAVAELGPEAHGVQADAGKVADLDRLFAEIKQKYGRVDVVFANAGGGEFAPIDAITEEHFDTTFASNVKGVVFTVQKALPLMVKGGTIVLNASIVSQKGFPAFGVYSATKAAVRSFARTWTNELKDRESGDVVSPGPIDTPGMEGSQRRRRRRSSSRLEWRRRFRWDGWARRTRLRRRWCFWRRMTRVLWPVWSYLWMGA